MEAGNAAQDDYDRSGGTAGLHLCLLGALEAARWCRGVTKDLPDTSTGADGALTPLAHEILRHHVTMELRGAKEALNYALGLLSRAEGLTANQFSWTLFRNSGDIGDLQLQQNLETPGFLKKVGLAISSTWVGKVMRTRSVKRGQVYLGVLISSVLYYADICKDVFIAYHFQAKVLGLALYSESAFRKNAYAMSVFVVMVGSIVATEAVNFATILRLWTRSEFKISRHTVAYFTPFAPGIFAYNHLVSRLKEVDCVRKADSAAINGNSWLELGLSIREGQKWALWRATLKGNEAAVESLPQVIFLILVLLTEASSSSTVQTFGNIVITENKAYLGIAIATSICAIVLGHVSYLMALKKGSVPILSAFLILPTYFFVSTLVRISAAVLFFTPLLGLFGILKIAKMALIPGSPSTLSDVYTNYTTLSLEEEWSELQIREVYEILSGSPIYTGYAIVGCILPIIHLLVGYAVNYVYKVDTGLRHVLYTFICPPLYFDWEGIYRKNKGAFAIEMCFLRARNAYLIFVGIFALEHLLLCIPLMLLRPIIAERLDLLDKNQFAPLPEEEQSLQIANMLLYSSLGLFIVVVPTIQILLALTYIKYGHPWSAILREEVAIFPWDRVAKHESIPMQELRR